MSFPSLDHNEQGWTVVVVADSDASLAEAVAKRLAGRVWDSRAVLWDELEKGIPLAAALAAAAAIDGRTAGPGGGGGPVVITDAADNVGGGAPGDTPGLLRELLANAAVLGKPGQTALLHFPDPAACRAAVAAGVGASVELEVGGKLDPQWGRPVSVAGTVLAVADGPIENCAPGGAFGGTGPTVATGSLACIAVGNIRLVLSELKVQGPHPSIFKVKNSKTSTNCFTFKVCAGGTLRRRRHASCLCFILFYFRWPHSKIFSRFPPQSVGLDPFEADTVVLLKSGTGWQTTYEPVAAGMIRADLPGPMSYNCIRFPWKRLQRSVFPLDLSTTFVPDVLQLAAL